MAALRYSGPLPAKLAIMLDTATAVLRLASGTMYARWFVKHGGFTVSAFPDGRQVSLFAHTRGRS